ncbi:pyridoxal phosphate-dependent aminotransferase [Lentzea sp. NBRC 102530]|uniref:pyridoxal phosphate-dependent aminotransferase n=1 Tax=Lentzea sp. NBRC 102530 TaxID=3032201 RepID=UPI0024A3E1F9|nr:pyridoxal phosphate-dependent aminotransferase [Lentzea sp. NBRC 102530]GLY48968.1 aminopeptidase [Lentzea sp. NBRC 102530]
MAEVVAMSATLAADADIARRQAAGEQVLSMASGEIGLPVLPELRARLAASAGSNAYGPVEGSSALRSAAAGYWERRGLDADPDLVVAGPGSKSLLFAVLLALGGDVVVPVPGWVSYPSQALLAGVRPIPVAVSEGGVPDPELVRSAVITARAAGQNPRAVVVTVPDNPSGSVASELTVRRLAAVCRELDLFIVSDEIYCDLVFGSPAVSPASVAPERTVVTTGLTKNLAVGGWRTGVVRLPNRELHSRLVSVASQIWSSAPAPVQAAAAYAFSEPAEVVERVAAGRRLHFAVASAVAARFAAAGALLAPVRATCYLYPDFEPLREHLALVHNVHGCEHLAAWFGRAGIGLLAGSAFGEPTEVLRIRAATSRLYGSTEEQQVAALSSDDPLRLPWIRAAVERIDDVLSGLTVPDSL